MSLEIYGSGVIVEEAEEKIRRLSDRDGSIWVDFCSGVTQAALARQHGVSEVRIGQIVKSVRDSIPASDRGEILLESLELIRRIQREAIKLVEMTGAPVAVGKDGTVLRDPDTDEVVRDYSLRTKAAELALKANDTLAKRLGLDSPTKIESTARVAYTLEGVNPADLT